MTNVSYAIWLCNPVGTRLRLFSEQSIVSLKLARSLNNVGTLELVIPATFDFASIVPDAQIEMYRTSAGGITELVTETRWLVVGFKRSLIGGVKTYTLLAYSGLDIITRACVLYPAGDTTYTSKTTHADNLMKLVVLQNLGASTADSVRLAYKPPLTIQADATAAPSISKDFAKENVFTLCTSLADASATAGTLLYFDVVWNNAVSSFEFRTYVAQRGQDLSSGNSMVQFSPYRENIRDVSVEYDYRNEYNYVYVAGQGTETLRTAVQRYSTARMSASPYGKREYFKDSRQVQQGSTNELASLNADGDAVLRSNRPMKIFTGTLFNTTACEFGTHWHWGDRVQATWDADTFICMISTVTIELSGGVETISGGIRSVA